MDVTAYAKSSQFLSHKNSEVVHFKPDVIPATFPTQAERKNAAIHRRLYHRLAHKFLLCPSTAIRKVPRSLNTTVDIGDTANGRIFSNKFCRSRTGLLMAESKHA